jgi:hypothetical protein
MASGQNFQMTRVQRNKVTNDSNDAEATEADEMEERARRNRLTANVVNTTSRNTGSPAINGTATTITRAA